MNMDDVPEPECFTHAFISTLLCPISLVTPSAAGFAHSQPLVWPFADISSSPSPSSPPLPPNLTLRTKMSIPWGAVQGASPGKHPECCECVLLWRVDRPQRPQLEMAPLLGSSWTFLSRSPELCTALDPEQGDQAVAPVVNIGATVPRSYNRNVSKWDFKGYYFHYFPLS